MSYQATVQWSRRGATFLDDKYSAEHEWIFDGGAVIPASSSPHVVPTPYSSPGAIDPEEALIVAIASCHMLSFLHIAQKKGFLVDDYRDVATGIMAKNEAGNYWISDVTLHPKISFSGQELPSSEAIFQLHHIAHEVCFIANSVRTKIHVEPGAMNF